MRTEMFQQSLEELNGSTADIEASALISTDGLMIASALAREETRGVHFRADCPEPSDAWLAHVAWRRGSPQPRLEPRPVAT